MITNLSLRQQLLLMAFHDGELGAFGRWRAERLLQRSEQARSFIADFRRLGTVLASRDASPAVDLWQGIEQRILAEERARRFLGPRQIEVAEGWHPPLWVLGGASALSAALATLIVVPFGPPSSTAPSSTAFLGDLAANPVSLSSQQERVPVGMEVDWVRGAGPVQVLPDPLSRSPIIWVRRREAVSGSEQRSSLAPTPTVAQGALMSSPEAPRFYGR